MKRATERRGTRPTWRPWWIAIPWILREERNRKKSCSLNTTNERIPGRADATFENPAPDDSQPENTHSADEKIELLYPSTWTQAERTHRLPPGIIARPGRAFNHIDDRKQHSTSDSTGKQKQQGMGQRPGHEKISLSSSRACQPTFGQLT